MNLEKAGVAMKAALEEGKKLVGKSEPVEKNENVPIRMEIGMILEKAKVAKEAALDECKKLDVKMNIAIVDAGGNLVYFQRMDGAWLGSMDIAMKKAKTAVLFDMPCSEIGELSQPGGPLYNIEISNGGLITFPGGLPVHNENGVLIGGIGVSGSTVENDLAVAEAAREAIFLTHVMKLMKM